MFFLGGFKCWRRVLRQDSASQSLDEASDDNLLLQGDGDYEAMCAQWMQDETKLSDVKSINSAVGLANQPPPRLKAARDAAKAAAIKERLEYHRRMPVALLPVTLLALAKTVLSQ